VVILFVLTEAVANDGLLDDPDKCEGDFLTFCVEH
jgi:hypothetical protein